MRRGVRWALALGVIGVASMVALPGADAQQTHRVDIIDDEYLPAELTVNAGDVVTWVAAQTNLDDHTVHENSGLFDAVLEPGQSVDRTFTSAGTYAYHCDFHPSMSGVVVVEAVVPGAPREVAATAGVGSVTVAWSPPAFHGGSVLTGYVVTASPGGHSVSVPAEATTATIEGLEPGTEYLVEVVAVNAVGAGPAATSNPVTPVAPDPDPDPGAGACPEDVAPAGFTDRDAVPETHRGNVDCASSLGVISGFADGTYRPSLSVRRDQMASFIARGLDAAGVELPAAAGARFTDVAPGSAHDEAIHRLAAAGIVQGGAGGSAATAYGGEQRVRRDQMASFLLRAAAFATQQDLASQTQAFADVGSANPHFANVNGAAQVGLATGFADRTYRPGAGVRRDQMATFVVRLLTHLAGGDGGLSSSASAP